MSSYDAVIVGARCAGAPLARFLARAGKSVVLVDAGDLPTDQPISTHFIQPYGMRILDELELGDRVREIAPPVSVVVNGAEHHLARIRFTKGGSCPRRLDLDRILLEGAREAGAEIRLRSTVVDVLREAGRVAGVIVEQPDGQRSEIRGGVVVGADGRSSTVAKLVGAEEYFGYDSPRAAYWAYYPRPSWYGDDPRYDNAAMILYNAQLQRFVFPTNRDQLIMGVTFPLADLGHWKVDPRKALELALADHPLTGPLIAGAEPLGKVIGLVKARFFFRRAAGPGWALVGDAGLHKDPSPGLGISDALRDARALSAAIVTGGDPALERYWRQRDVDSFELFNFASDLGRVDYNNPLTQMLIGKIAVSDDLKARLVEVVERRLSPFEAFTPGEVMRWTLGSLLRGQFGVLRPFFASARRSMAVKREMKRRRDLLTLALPAGS